MSDQFITMVLKMREAQKAFFEGKKRGDMMEAIKWETRVDVYLQNYVAEKVQLELWTCAMRTDETPGAYNVEHESKAEETGGA